MSGFSFESECVRARASMAGMVDGDLIAGQRLWLDGHLAACADCRAVRAGFIAIDDELTAWGEKVGRDNPPPPGERERLAAAMGLPERRHRSMRWAPMAALAVAAALVLAVALRHNKPAAQNSAGIYRDSQFVEIPYLAPLDPRENATIVRMDIQVATLVALGYRVAADPDAIVPADVLVGEDGRAHAVRVISGIDLNETRGD